MKELGSIEALVRWPFDWLRAVAADQRLWIADRESVTAPEPVIATMPLPAERVEEIKNDRLEELCERIVVVAEREIGKGELPGKNNRGPDIARYCDPYGDGHAWCAGFVGFCIKEASKELFVPMPCRRSLRAKKQADHIAKVGSRFKDYKLAKRGDFLVFDRGATGSLLGHIEIVEHPLDLNGHVHTIPGNSNPLVIRRRRNPADPKLRFREVVSLRKI